MPDFYDALETRAPEAREREQFSNLPGLIARAMSAPGWAEQLAGIDPKSVTSRAALAGAAGAAQVGPQGAAAR